MLILRELFINNIRIKMDNNKETLYTFKLTESELIRLKEAIDIALVQEENEDLTHFNNIFSNRIQKIKNKKDNLIKKLKKQSLKN
tara:strand:- start:3947 stop:4201 length:255 start_codon:yes stop_codon:yes gene_type:complete